MKKHANTHLKSIFITSISTILIVLQVKASNVDSSKTPRAVITSSDRDEKVVAFDVEYDGIDREPFYLELTPDGLKLTCGAEFNYENLNKKIYLKDEPDNCAISSSLRGKKEIQRETFKISNQKRVLQEIVVERL